MTTLVATLALGLLAQGAKDVDLNPVVDKVSFDEAPVGMALTSIFQPTGIKFKIAPEVKGVVTALLRRVTLSTAVKVVAKQVNAGYEVRDGEYRVFSYDSPPSGQNIPTFVLSNADATVAIAAAFRHHLARYEVDKAVTGRVQIDVENISFEAALRAVLDQLGADYQVKKGVYFIQKGQVNRAK